MADQSETVYVPASQIKANRLIGIATALTILVLDQLIKWVVTEIFDLRWVENRGVSMGFLTTDSELERWLLVVLTAGIAGFVATWLWREKRRDDIFALGLVLGGALGNIIDRIRLGYVVDYADLHFGEVRPFLIFNVADAAITIGVLLLVLRALLTRERKPPQKDE